VWLVSIAYGNGIWVVVGDKGTVLVSSDLKNWIHATSATTTKLDGVLYNGTVWVAVGEAGTIVKSSDAQNWVLEPAIPGVTGWLHGITLTGTATPENGLLGPVTNFLVSGQNGVLLGANSSGANFAILPETVKPPGGIPGVIPTQNMEAVLNYAPGPISAQTETGANGVTVIAGNGIIFSGLGAAVGSTIGSNNFVAASGIPSVDFRGLTYGNGYWIAAGDQGTIFRSTDGTNWLQSYAGDSPSTLSTATLLSAAYSSLLQRFVVTGTGGTILVSSPPPTVFANVSTRGYVSSTQTFIGGFVIEGTAPRTVLVRADGPVLGTFGVSTPLPDPVLTVYNSSGTTVASNTGWTTNTNPASISTAALEVGAFALPNPGLDSALLLTLQPGAYTAQITSAKGNSGIALIEAYTN